MGGMSCFIVQAFHGLGHHSDTNAKADTVIYSQAGWFQSVVSATFALGFLKLSIAFTLLRLSKSKWYSWSLWGLVGKTYPTLRHAGRSPN